MDYESNQRKQEEKERNSNIKKLEKFESKSFLSAQDLAEIRELSNNLDGTLKDEGEAAENQVNKMQAQFAQSMQLNNGLTPTQKQAAEQELKSLLEKKFMIENHLAELKELTTSLFKEEKKLEEQHTELKQVKKQITAQHKNFLKEKVFDDKTLNQKQKIFEDIYHKADKPTRKLLTALAHDPDLINKSSGLAAQLEKIIGRDKAKSAIDHLTAVPEKHIEITKARITQLNSNIKSIHKLEKLEKQTIEQHQAIKQQRKETENLIIGAENYLKTVNQDLIKANAKFLAIKGSLNNLIPKEYLLNMQEGLNERAKSTNSHTSSINKSSKTPGRSL